jgi:hypothetical protein
MPSLFGLGYKDFKFLIEALSHNRQLSFQYKYVDTIIRLNLIVFKFSQTNATNIKNNLELEKCHTSSTGL